MANHLHIVSFNVPFPANYGGVIDVFYKIKALHQEGIKIILHCFLYDRAESKELEKYCEKVFYYPRKRELTDFFNSIPFIVKSRNHPDLLKNLSTDDYPILFEGLHCCGFLSHPLLKHKKKLVRVHNIEHEYYDGLAELETNFLKRVYFKSEAKKLKNFEKHLAFADELLAISKYDELYFRDSYPSVLLIPPFHKNQEISLIEKSEDYLLFVADFNVSINQAFAKELNEEAKALNKKLILAGKVDFKNTSDLEILENPTEIELEDLISKAYINFISVKHQSGFKLKLIDAIYLSKQVIIIGESLQELDSFNCDQLHVIPNLSHLQQTIEKINADKTTLQQIVNQRKKAADYFNVGLNVLNLVSAL